MENNLKYTVDVQPRMRNMDLTIERWLEIYSKEQIKTENKNYQAYFKDEQLEIFLQMIVNEVKMTPMFIVFEKDGYYSVVSSRLMQLLYRIGEIQKDPTIDPRMIRRILSHKPNVLLVEASTKLDPQDIINMTKFYL